MSKNSPEVPGAAVALQRLFGEFTLGSDLARNGQPLAITPKALAVLNMLVQRAGQLVTKQELWDAVWPRVIVTDAALTMCVAEIRRVLGDDARQPAYIATVPKRGYRFISRVAVQPASTVVAVQQAKATAEPALLAREQELDTLQHAVSTAKQRLVLVVGEAGIGKTALLSAFKAALARTTDCFVLSGQCYQHFGPAEPYLPVLEGLSQLCRSDAGGPVRDCLEQYAPLWLTQLPSVLAPADAERLQQRIVRATPERMQRELTDALEALAAHAPVVLCLEDIHWCDRATLDWLNHLTRRRSSARVHVIATVRDAQAIRGNRPVREFLRTAETLQQCLAMPMSRLPEASVREYLERRCDAELSGDDRALIDELAQLLHARTNGNPLYLISVVDEVSGSVWRENGSQSLRSALHKLRQAAMPESLMQLIVMQLEQLSREELALLEVASVAGDSFAAAVLADGLETSEQACELRCEELAHETRLLQHAGLAEWPDGTVTSRYAFKHSLYRETLYARLPAGRVARLHRLIGQRLERAHDARPTAIAGELAMHFSKGHLHGPAASYCLIAGRNALARGAYAEAEGHFRHGIEQLTSDILEPSELLRQTELDLQMALGQTMLATRGWASTTAEHAFARAYHLSATGQPGERFMPLWGMAMVSVVRGDFARYDALGHELMRHATASADRMQIACAHWVVGQRMFHIGKFRGSLAEFELALDGFQAVENIAQIRLLGAHYGVFTLSYLSHVRWCLGHSEQALAVSATAQALAAEINHPYSASIAHAYAALLHVFMGDTRQAEQASNRLIDLSREQGFEYYLGWGQFIRAWACDTMEAQTATGEDMKRGLDLMEATGASLRRSFYFALLAEQHLLKGRSAAASEALQAACDGLALTHEVCWEAELHRIQGLLAEASGGDDATAERHYRQALATAHGQDALSFELRAALPLARLLARSARSAEARSLLDTLCARVEQHPEYTMLRETRALMLALPSLRRSGSHALPHAK